MMKRLLAIVVLTAALGACGLKGPLYMPDQSPKKPTWPPPAQTTPTDTPASSDRSK